MVSTNMKRWLGGLVCALAMLASPAAMAEIVRLSVTWAQCDMRGNFVAGSAAASATLTMDTASGPHVPGPAISFSMDQVISLSLTVTGTGAGDGTFGKNDFASMYFSYGHALNFNGELMGQYVYSGDPSDHVGAFGGSIAGGGQNGTFNFIAKTPGTSGGPAAAPSGVYPFMMVSNGYPRSDPLGGVDVVHAMLGVKSIIATPVSAVPEPSTYAMLLGGLGVAGLMARRRR